MWHIFKTITNITVQLKLSESPQILKKDHTFFIAGKYNCFCTHTTFSDALIPLHCTLRAAVCYLARDQSLFIWKSFY
jgi:hypothetical protein